MVEETAVRASKEETDLPLSEAIYKREASDLCGARCEATRFSENLFQIGSIAEHFKRKVVPCAKASPMAAPIKPLTQQALQLLLQ